MKETTEQTTASSSGSFSGPVFGKFLTKKEIYKLHNKKNYNSNEEEISEATVADSSGAYDAPFGDGSSNPLKIGGEKTIKKRMKKMRSNKFPMWGGPNGVFVSVKEKCKKYPYCNQGDVKSLEFYENEELNEVVKEVAKEYGLPINEVERLVINDIKRIFI